MTPISDTRGGAQDSILCNLHGVADGRFELVIAGDGTAPRVFAATDDATWSQFNSVVLEDALTRDTNNPRPFSVRVHCADLNGDGFTDVIVHRTAQNPASCAYRCCTQNLLKRALTSKTVPQHALVSLLTCACLFCNTCFPQMNWDAGDTISTQLTHSATRSIRVSVDLICRARRVQTRLLLHHRSRRRLRRRRCRLTRRCRRLRLRRRASHQLSAQDCACGTVQRPSSRPHHHPRLRRRRRPSAHPIQRSRRSRPRPRRPQRRPHHRLRHLPTHHRLPRRRSHRPRRPSHHLPPPRRHHSRPSHPFRTCQAPR